MAAKVKAYVELTVLHIFNSDPGHRRESLHSVPKWTPPPAGTVLINIDAALFASSRRMGVGVVVRNHIGECLAACSERLDGITTPELAEALAFRRSTALARDEGYQNVIIASDCLSVVQRLNLSRRDRSTVGAVISDIKSMAEGFSSVVFRHVSRVVNVAAHTLARSCDHFVSSFIRNGVPDFIRKTLYNDVL